MPKGAKSINKLHKEIASTHDLIATAHHEAGHSVFGLIHFMKIGSVSIFNNSKSCRSEGTTNYEAAIDDDTEDKVLLNYWINSELGLSYAGTCAEKIYYKKISGVDKLPKFLKDGSEDDLSFASYLIKKYDLAPPGDKRYAFKQKKIKETSIILEQYWEDIVLLSHTLFDKKRLYYNDIKELLLKQSIKKDYWKKQFKTIDYISDNAPTINSSELKKKLAI